MNRKPISTAILGNNIELMKQYPDGYFDLGIVDPEYGIGAGKMTMGTGKNKKWEKGKDWDSKIPDKAYFQELFRVSKNQIIWGGNYFAHILPPSRGWIFWDKMLNKDLSFADGELAWTSFDTSLKVAKIQYNGFLGSDESRIHPTQKPVKLYSWLLRRYAQKGDKILDTHLGGGSHRIAAYELGFDFVGMEIDKGYFDDSVKRFKEYTSMPIFDRPISIPSVKPIQSTLINNPLFMTHEI